MRSSILVGTQLEIKMEMKEEIKTIAKQINYKELVFCKFKFIYDNDKLSLGLYKGSKHFIIELDEGRDLYNIRKVRIRKFKIVEDIKINGIFCDQLSDMIEEYFQFRYINKVVFS